MFITKIKGNEELAAKAAVFGLVVGEAYDERTQVSLPAIGGNTFAMKDQIKAAGARWDATNKVWAFRSYDAFTAALSSLS